MAAPPQNHISQIYLEAILANDREMLLQLAAEQPIAAEDAVYDAMCECGCGEQVDIREAAMYHAEVTVETHRTLFEIGLISKTNMKYLDKFISYTTTPRDEEHLEMLLHEMDHPTIAAYRVELGGGVSDSFADRMCFCHVNPSTTRIPELIEYAVGVIGIDPTILGGSRVPLIYRAIAAGWVHLVEFLLDRGVAPVVHLPGVVAGFHPILRLIDNYVLWSEHFEDGVSLLVKYHQNTASTIADMIDLLAEHDYPFAEQALGLAAKLAAAGLPAVEPRLAPFAVIA